MVELPWAADWCPCVVEAATVLPYLRGEEQRRGGPDDGLQRQHVFPRQVTRERRERAHEQNHREGQRVRPCGGSRQSTASASKSDAASPTPDAGGGKVVAEHHVLEVCVCCVGLFSHPG